MFYTYFAFVSSFVIRNSHFRCFLLVSLFLCAIAHFHGCLIRLSWIIYGILPSQVCISIIEMRKNQKSGMDSFEWSEINGT